jgi:hypothetical protein
MIILKYLSYYQIPDYNDLRRSTETFSLYMDLAIFKCILHILKYVLYNRIFGFYSSRATFDFQRVNDFLVLKKLLKK